MRNDVPGQFCVTEKLDCVALTKNIALTGIGLIQRSCTDPRGREKSEYIAKGERKEDVAMI